MAVYLEKFSVGSEVWVVPLDKLEEFRRTWHLHHPLEARQLSFAGRRATVERVAFYHGGDVLYSLQDVPGIWHEVCLAANNHVHAV